MNDVIITVNGTPETIVQDVIVSPKFECDGCMTPAEYVRRIAERGITTVVPNGDGSYTYRHISPHCICEVEFIDSCNIQP